ncbi:MAG: hypothetical protein OEZ23_07655, partial [Gammaproteobacteria bacterium]|nr:hypothetical protein [Gammaproteobacteria bacterium]
MSISIDQVEKGLQAFLSEKAGNQVIVSDVQKIFGGASRETFRLKVLTAGDSEPRGMILRRDPPTSLIDTERA